jgi:hypothetical protein
VDLECRARTKHAVAMTVSVATVTSFALPTSVFPTAMLKLNADDALQQAKKTAR